MSILDSIVLGIVQGLTEFLPVSSSGHLVLLQNVFGISGPQLFFDTMLHMGTLVAVVIVLWQNIVDIFKNFFSKMTLCLIIATIPAIVATLFLGDFFEETFTGIYLGYEFLLTAVVLALSEVISKHVKSKREIGIGTSLTMGVAQAIAILPAVSRSGLTIAGGLVSGVDRRKAASFSFLMSIPAIIGSVVLQSSKIFKDTSIHVEWLPTLIGTACAAVSGYFAIKFMLALISKKRLYGFAIYVAVLGVFVLLDQFLLKTINWAY